MEPFCSRRPIHTLNAGFTLVELMVVLAIITVISAITLTSQSSFNKSLILANTAYDIALTLRSAQTYGLSSRARAGAGAASPNAGYGLHFQTGLAGSFILFADTYPAVGGSPLCHTPPANDPRGPDAKSGNCVYDQDRSERVTEYELGNGITVSNFCALVSGSWRCMGGGGIATLDIVFTRPNPNPFISTDGSYTATASAACITVTSPQGGAKHIQLSASGQIIANAASDPASCHD